MGYTHYWKRVKPVDSQAFARFVADVRKIVNGCDVPLQFDFDDDRPVEITESHVFFNGVGDDGCEVFFVDSELQDALNFCKTNRLPYDKVVAACLISLKHHLGDAVQVTSDGTIEDWYPGFALHLTTVGDAKGLAFGLLGLEVR